MNSVMVNGIRVYGPDSSDTLINFVISNPQILIAINAEKIYHASLYTRSIINNHVGYPDGIGAVYALRKKGILQKTRIPGCNLWLEIIKKHNRDKSFFFVGAKSEIIEQTINKIKYDYPDINIVGYHDGYFDTKEESKLINEVITKKPDVVFVAMGSPRQEIFMSKLYQKHKAVYQGLGGSFDLYVGLVKETPLIFQKNGFHWLYRAFQQPYRIKRHSALIKFMYNLYFTSKY